MILPSSLALLGVPRSDGDGAREEMQAARDRAVEELPREFREWLEKSLRFGSARDYITRRCESRSDATRSLLKTQYNACLESLQQLCSRRSRLVCRYLPQIKAVFIDRYDSAEQEAIEACRLGTRD